MCSSVPFLSPRLKLFLKVVIFQVRVLQGGCTLNNPVLLLTTRAIGARTANLGYIAFEYNFPSTLFESIGEMSGDIHFHDAQQVYSS